MDCRKNLPFKSYGANMQTSYSSPRAVFTHFRDQPEAQLVRQVLLERLATGAHQHKTSEIGHCLPATTHRGYEASYAHAQYTSVLQSEPEPNSAECFALFIG